MKVKTRLSVILLFVVSLLLVSTITVLAQGEEPPAPADLTLTSILMWILAGPGVAYVIGLLQTQVLENIPAWHELSPQLKVIITMALAGGLAIGAQLLLAWPGLSSVEPWANTIIMAIVVWLSSQKEYRVLKVEGSNYGVRKLPKNSEG